MTTGNKLPRGVLVPAEKRYRPEIQGRRPFLIVATGSGKTIPDALTPVTSNRYGEQAYGRSGPACRGAMGIAGRCGAGETAVGRRRTCQRSRLPAAGRAKTRWICRFASSTSTRSGFCRYWLEKLPERTSGRSAKGSGEGLGMRSGPARTTTNPQASARHRAAQFPLRPYE